MTAALARSATPADQLLRLVPDDVGFCVVVQDLRDQLATLRSSPFWRAFWATPVGARLLQSPEAERLAAVAVKLQERVQIDWPRLRDELLGDAVAFAYRPGPPEQPDQEQGLFMVWARDTKLLGDLVERFNRGQQQTGTLKEVVSREHRGAKYYRRVETRGEHFYYLSGHVLAFTGEESLLRQVMDRHLPAAAAAVTFPRRARPLALKKALAVWWINPRAFEPALRFQAAQASGPDAAVLKAVEKYWKALDDIVVSAALPGEGLTLGLGVAVRGDALPVASRRALADGVRRSQLWDRWPADALVAVAGRLDPDALGGVLSEFLPAGAREEIRKAVDHVVGPALGKDLTTEVLPYLGPDWGLCASAPGPSDQAWCPQVTMALRVRPDAQGAEAGKALVGAFHTLASLAVIGYNSRHSEPVRLKTEAQDRVEVISLEHDKLFPPGWRPAFALKEGYFLLATSPEAVRRFTVGVPAGSPTAEVPLLRCSLRRLSQYLKDHHNQLAGFIADQHHCPPSDAGRRLEKLASVVSLFDGVELTQRSGPDRVVWTLHVRSAQPMQK
jgi:hypothetical protein